MAYWSNTIFATWYTISQPTYSQGIEQRGKNLTVQE